MSAAASKMAGRARWAAAVAVGLALGGCGGRAAIWSQPVDLSSASFGLHGAVAIVDRPADRVVLLTPGAQQSLAVTAVPTGRRIVSFAPSADGQRLFVLSAGHRAALGDPEPDQKPSLTIVEAGGAPSSRLISLDLLSDPLSGLALDPTGRWVVLYAGGDNGDAFVENPNELVILDLDVPPGMAPVPVAHTLQSFGGKVTRLAFTPALHLPATTTTQHLLVVETDRDLSLLSLEHSEVPEISVPLTAAGDTRHLAPAGIAVDDGDPARDDDARIGVRLDGDSSLVTLQLVAADTANGFRPTVNLSDAGGIPSDIAFVRTDGGLRLAALVPSRSQAALVDPETGAVTAVALPVAYQSLSLVTGGGATPTDVALLWNGAGGATGGATGAAAAGGVAFWDLGRTSGAPYRSVEPIAVGGTIDRVLDVPAPHANLKVLSASADGTFYVLDLVTRTIGPLVESSSLAPWAMGLGVSPFGDAVLAFTMSTTDAATIDLATAHPRSLLVDRPVHQLFEVATAGGQGRSLVAIHDQGDIGATVFDAATADGATRRLYAGLLLEGTP